MCSHANCLYFATKPPKNVPRLIEYFFFVRIKLSVPGGVLDDVFLWVPGIHSLCCSAFQTALIPLTCHKQSHIFHFSYKWPRHLVTVLDILPTFFAVQLSESISDIIPFPNVFFAQAFQGKMEGYFILIVYKHFPSLS